MKSKPLDKLTKKNFKDYERVRCGGRWNMIVNAREAAMDAGLHLDTYMGVLSNYSALMEKYPDVRKVE